MGYLLPAGGGPALPLDLERAKMAARKQAQDDVSLQMLKQAAARMARARQEHQLGGLATSGLLGAENLDKEAFIAPLLSLGTRGAAALASKGGAMGRVGQFLQRKVRSPIQVARSGGGVAARVRSPLAPVPKPQAAPRGGAYRTPGRAATRDLVAETAQEGARKPGLVRGFLRSVAAPAALLGGGWLAYKGAQGLGQIATQRVQMPPAYGYGSRQYQYGYTPEGQAQF